MKRPPDHAVLVARVLLHVRYEVGQSPIRVFYPRSKVVGTILLIVLILLLIGALPSWPYSSGWGYYPSGGIGPDRGGCLGPFTSGTHLGSTMHFQST